MTKSTRRVHDTAFKTKVVLEAFKGTKTLAQLASEFGIHPQQITDWKKQALDGLPTLFDSPTAKPTLTEQQREDIEAPLFQQIGRLKVENDWLKKNCERVDRRSTNSHQPYRRTLFHCLTMPFVRLGPIQLLLLACG